MPCRMPPCCRNLVTFAFLFFVYHTFAAQSVYAADHAQSGPTEANRFIQFDAGGSHTCAASVAGEVWCWGENLYGQVGDGSTTPRNAPVAVRGLASGVEAVHTGTAFTCALLDVGYVQCWGRNEYGQLGNSNLTYRHLPANQAALHGGVIAIDAGGSHACALTEQRQLYCWGQNEHGQVGAGDSAYYTVPTLVPTLVAESGYAVEAVATGDSHTCVLTATSEVLCWGDNTNGQLGDGTTASRATPMPVIGLDDETIAITAGMNYTCALLRTGAVQCWGDNENGKLGDGTDIEQVSPVNVMGLHDAVTQIAGGAGHVCALTTTGVVQCWGNYSYGQLGAGPVRRNESPLVTVPDLNPDTIAVSAGGSHSCALAQTGQLQCWGKNDSGQLGNGDNLVRTKPTQVAERERPAALLRAIATGYSQSCAIGVTGSAYCWGNNEFGQLGNGEFTNQGYPVAVYGLDRTVSALAIGYAHTCALTSDKRVQCWGNNELGQVGNGRFSQANAPSDLSNLDEPIDALTAGGFHTCALATGSVYCWGENVASQLGDGGTLNRNLAIRVSGLDTEIAAISAGWAHTCALDTAGSVFCWGGNASGQLGDGTTITPTSAVAVLGLTDGVSAIAAGGDHTCALTNAGSVFCWGRNVEGQLGDGTSTDRSVPTLVTGLPADIVALTAGGAHNCVLARASGVYCWGSNNIGQLGSDISPGSPVPLALSSLQSGITSIHAGGEHTCALIGLVRMQCWGSNTFGQLGDGNFIGQGIPNLVRGLHADLIAVASGFEHTCALSAAGTVQCWGSNFLGQLGDKTVSGGGSPITITTLAAPATAISAGIWHSCALLATGGVQCWGGNISGQLGNGTLLEHDHPVMVRGLESGAIAVASGGFHTCAIRESGGVQCWGDNYLGQLGIGKDGTPYSDVPLTVSELAHPAAKLAVGTDHTCVLNTVGGVECWGSNEFGQLGNGSREGSSNRPVAVTGLDSGVVAIAAGGYHTCVLLEDNSIQCWGKNDFGQLGDNTLFGRSAPVAVRRVSRATVALSAGLTHTCALAQNGNVQCWGGNEFGQLQVDSVYEYLRLTPVDIEDLFGNVIALAAGGLHTCALTSTADVQCWGSHWYGQIGVQEGWLPVDVRFY